MALDPQAVMVLEAWATSVEKPFSQSTIEEIRTPKLAPTQGEPVHEVIDRTVPGPGGDIPVRVYRPAADERLPVLVYFHGGAFVTGGVDSIDAMCRELTNRSGCIVLSVAYRLAPENKFPAAADDCYVATLWASRHADEIGGDGSRLAVGGDSAGGNLAAVVALMARDRGTPPLMLQLLVYPAVDYEFERPSMLENGSGDLIVSIDDLKFFWSNYLTSEDDTANPYAIPFRAETLGGVAPAFVVTAEHDPLRDEGAAYAERLRRDGVPAVVRMYPGMIHGFFQMSAALDRGKDAVQDAAAALRRAFGLSPTQR